MTVSSLIIFHLGVHSRRTVVNIKDSKKLLSRASSFERLFFCFEFTDTPYFLFKLLFMRWGKFVVRRISEKVGGLLNYVCTLTDLHKLNLLEAQSEETDILHTFTNLYRTLFWLFLLNRMLM